MNISLYYKNDCSKSKTCLKILKKRNLKFKLIEYIKHPLKQSEINSIIENLVGDRKKILRSFQNIEMEVFNSKKKLSNFLFLNQNLLQRPILFYKKKYWICRPPEKILNILAKS